MLPSGLIAATGLGSTLLDRGSIAAEDWLRWAILAALVVCAAALGGGLVRTSRAALAAGAALFGLAVWDAASIAWAPLPALARDESLLVCLYLLCFAVPALTLRTERDRLAAIGCVAAGAALVAVGTGLRLWLDPDFDSFFGGRLAFPISYANGQAAVFLVGFWPAIAAAGSRTLPVAVRALAAAAASATAGGWVLTQSKGGGIALGVSLLVVLALSPVRLRLLPPLLIVGVPLVLAGAPLTEPYRDSTTVAIRNAGLALLAAAAASAVAGFAYALLDRRLELTATAQKRIGQFALAATVATLIAGSAVVLAADPGPRERGARAWDRFKQPAAEVGSTHFESLGSNRYDFWRVALRESRASPVTGAGSRSFGTVYLRERTSAETPARTHSLPLEALLETGLVGLLLLGAAVGVPLLVAARAAATMSGVAVLGAAVYWLVHASGDWIWTLPSAGIPFFLLLGVAVAGHERSLSARSARGAAVAAALLALAVFTPPWLSARLSNDALSKGDTEQLGLAARLDPLSPRPYFLRSILARTHSEAVEALEEAVARAPSAPELRVALSEALLAAGRPRLAAEELRYAHSLDPRNRRIRSALRQAERRAG